MQNYESQYLKVLKQLYKKAVSEEPSEDRTGTGRHRLFGIQIEHDMSLGFPVLTTKKVNWRASVKEAQWFLSGSTNINDLDSKIWDEWADESGSIGQMYGQQWRGIDKRGVQRTPDQIAIAVDTIKKNPNSARIIVDSWVPALIPLDGQTPQQSVLQERMALAPCHCLFQFFVDGDKLSLKLYQRSADIFLGVPFNAVGYAYLLMWVASITGKTPDKFIHSFGDVHLYDNHINQAHQQLMNGMFIPPEAKLLETGRKVKGFFANDLELINYRHAEAIKAPVSV